MSDHSSEDEQEQRRLRRGLAALASMDLPVRHLYLAEWNDWDEAPLDSSEGACTRAKPTLTADELLTRWQNLPTVDPTSLRAALDELVDPGL